MTEILALEDFLNYIICIHSGRIDSFQLILHRVLLDWVSNEGRETWLSIANTGFKHQEKKAFINKEILYIVMT